MAFAALLSLVLGGSWASAQDGDFSFNVRSSELSEDGTTQIVLTIGAELTEPLSADDVRLQENGQVVEDVTVEPLTGEEAQAVAVALLVDTSGSTQGEPLAAAKQAASTFLDGLADVEAQVTLIEFNTDASVVVPLTNDLSAVAAGIGGLEAGGETALYDAVALGTQQLQPLDAQRNIVVFSDGADTASETTLQDVTEAASGINAPIATVVLATEELDVASLNALSGGTGGSAVTVESAGDLQSAFADVAAELSNQYVVTYTSELESAELDITLDVTVGGQTRTTAYTVANPRRAEPVAVEPPVVEGNEPGPLGSNLGLILGVGAAFLSLAGLFGLIALTPRTRAAKLLDRELNTYVKGERRADPSAVAEALRQRASILFERSTSAAQFESTLQKRLDQGAVPLRSLELIAIMLVGTLLLATIGGVLVGWRGAIVLAPLGPIVPWVFVTYKRSKRLGRFLELLPDTLQLMAGSLSAGYGILQAIDMVVKESEDPVSTEFNRVLIESRLGMPLEESLEAMADRMDSDDFRWVVLAMNIQREVGGNLAQLMSTVADTLCKREALRRHIKALSAEGKLSAVVLVILPFFLAGYLVIVNPDYVATLTESVIGWILIGGGVVGLIIGMLWIRGLIRAIEV